MEWVIVYEKSAQQKAQRHRTSLILLTFFYLTHNHFSASFDKSTKSISLSLSES